MDCDIITCDSLKKLWEIDISNTFTAVVKEHDTEHQLKQRKRLGMSPNRTYFNTGVMLLNLKKWREDELETQLFASAVILKDLAHCADQDILNYTLDGRVKYVPIKFNYHASKKSRLFRRDNKQPKTIIHYLGKSKPWHKDCTHPHKQHYLKYLSYPQRMLHLIAATGRLLVHIKEKDNTVRVRIFRVPILKFNRRSTRARN